MVYWYYHINNYMGILFGEFIIKNLLSVTQIIEILTQLEVVFKSVKGDRDEFFNSVYEGFGENLTSDEEKEELNLLYNEGFAYLSERYFA